MRTWIARERQVSPDPESAGSSLGICKTEQHTATNTTVMPFKPPHLWGKYQMTLLLFCEGNYSHAEAVSPAFTFGCTCSQLTSTCRPSEICSRESFVRKKLRGSVRRHTWPFRVPPAKWVVIQDIVWVASVVIPDGYTQHTEGPQICVVLHVHHWEVAVPPACLHTTQYATSEHCCCCLFSVAVSY